MSINFTKGHGTGNDFVLVLDEIGQLDFSELEIQKLCDRNFGVGADGLIVIRPTKGSEAESLLDEESNASWFMDYRNRDGSKAEMCGNGIRVMARYLVDHELVKIDPGSTLPIATRAGIKDLTQTANGFAVDLGRFSIDEEEVLVKAAGLRVPRPGLSMDLGNPHVVVALADLDELEHLDLHKIPILDPEPEEGANVEFVVIDEPMIVEGVAGLSMRVFERGVGETLSCGTGVAASALAVRHWAGGEQNHWTVSVRGGDLGVRVFPTEEGEHVSISGPAELVFSGSWRGL